MFTVYNIDGKQNRHLGESSHWKYECLQDDSRFISKYNVGSDNSIYLVSDSINIWNPNITETLSSPSLTSY